MTNPILEAIYRDRNEHAKKFNYDIDAILDDCERIAIELGCTLVSRQDFEKREKKLPKLVAKTRGVLKRRATTNPILEEVFRNRDAIAKECNYDIDAIFDHAERTAKELGIVTVSRKDLERRDKKPKKVLAKQHARPTNAKKRTKATKH